MTAALPLAALLLAPPPFPDPAVVERLSERRPQFNYREADVPAYDLPGVLGGAATAADWPDRREELVRLFERHVYGVAPPKPRAWTSEATSREAAGGGAGATRRAVSIVSETPSGPFAFPVTLFVPAGASAESPAPLVVLIDNRGGALITTDGGGTGFFPWEAITDAGFAAAVFQNGDLAPDGAGTFDTKLLAADGTNRDGRPADGCGALAAWGWGASRVLDYCERAPELDASRVAVVGHSRGGKAALWAAARDPRFSIAYSNESGCGGAALSRRRFGETVARITDSFPHWFAPAFAEYAGREDDLPVDQHQLVAAIAPRAVYVASAADDLWADPRGEFLSLVRANPAFGLFGDPELSPGGFPPVGGQVIRGRRGYHLRAGEHDLTREDWDRFLTFAGTIWGTQNRDRQGAGPEAPPEPTP